MPLVVKSLRSELPGVAVTWGLRLFTKNTGLCEIVR